MYKIAILGILTQVPEGGTIRSNGHLRVVTPTVGRAIKGIVYGLAEAYLDGRVDDLDRATATASRAIVTGILAISPVADAA